MSDIYSIDITKSFDKNMYCTFDKYVLYKNMYINNV